MYIFAALLVAANVFTVWQETDAMDSAQRRRDEFEANKRAWEDRERLEAEEAAEQAEAEAKRRLQ